MDKYLQAIDLKGVNNESLVHKAKTAQKKKLLINQDKFRLTGLFIDVSLICNDGAIDAHKLILSAACPFFYTLFMETQRGENITEVEFIEYNVKSLTIVVQFLYTGEISDELAEYNKNELLKEVLTICNRMEISSFFDYCWEIYSSFLDVDNFVEMWDLSELYQKMETANVVANFAVREFGKISANSIFLNLKSSQIETLVRHLNDKSLIVCDDIVDFILKWGNVDNRIKHVINLMGFLNLDSLSHRHLHSLITTEPILKKSDQLNELFVNLGISRLLTNESITARYVNDRKIYFFNNNFIQVYNIDKEKWFLPSHLPEDKNYCLSLPKTTFQIFVHEDWFYFTSKFDGDIVKCKANMIKCDIITDFFLPKNNDVKSYVLCGNEFYVWSSNSFYKLNVDTIDFKLLDVIEKKNELNASLFLVKDTIYFCDMRTIYVYDKVANQWKYKTKFKANLISKNPTEVSVCQDKVCFLVNICDLHMYDPVKDLWTEKSFPKLSNMKQILLHNDQDCLLFCDNEHKNCLSLLDVENDKLTRIETGLIFPDASKCTVTAH